MITETRDLENTVAIPNAIKNSYYKYLVIYYSDCSRLTRIPGRALVTFRSFHTRSPLIQTPTMPSDNCTGFLMVALSVIVNGSNSTRPLYKRLFSNILPAISFNSFAATMAVISLTSRSGLYSTISAPTMWLGIRWMMPRMSLTESPPGSW